MRFAILAAIAAMLCSPAVAEPPTMKVTGPTQARSGTLIILDLDTDAEADSLQWDLPGLAQENWSVSPDKMRVYVVAAPGNYTVTTYGAKRAEEKIESAIARYVLVVTGTNPAPGPTPGPGPNPGPVETYGLTTWARTAVLAVAEPGRSRRGAVAAAFRRAADRAARNEFQSIDAAVSAVRTEYVAAMGPDIPAWRSFVNDGLIPEFKRLQDSGRIAAVADLAAAWREVAAGLD